MVKARKDNAVAVTNKHIEKTFYQEYRFGIWMCIGALIFWSVVWLLHMLGWLSALLNSYFGWIAILVILAVIDVILITIIMTECKKARKSFWQNGGKGAILMAAVVLGIAFLAIAFSLRSGSFDAAYAASNLLGLLLLVLTVILFAIAVIGIMWGIFFSDATCSSN